MKVKQMENYGEYWGKNNLAIAVQWNREEMEGVLIGLFQNG